MDSENIKSVHVIEDIMEEILSRLPVKSLLRFRCVSKSWLSLITSERFIEAHRHNSTKNKAFSHHKVIFECDRCALKECSLQQLLNEASSIEPSFVKDAKNNHGIAIGCCNGLICLLNSRYPSLYLWNPATMISIELPNIGNLVIGCRKFGFGWDGKSGAYKVIVFGINSLRLRQGNVYSSKTNSWKTVDYGCLGVYNIIGVFACGKIHWIIKMISEEEDYIESFDLQSEEFGRIELPFNPIKFHRPQYKLAEFEGCLHLLCVHDDHNNRQSYIVWVMKESGWLKLFTHRLVFELKSTCLRPILGGGPNGEILIMFSDNYLVYYPKEDHVVREGKNRFSFYEGLVYVESLVSPNFTTARALCKMLLPPSKISVAFFPFSSVHNKCGLSLNGNDSTHNKHGSHSPLTLKIRATPSGSHLSWTEGVHHIKDDVHVVQSVKNIISFSQRHVYVESLVSPNFTTAR